MLREIVMVPAREKTTWKPLFYRVYKSNGFLYFLSLPSTDPLINLACRKPPAFSDHDLGLFVFGTSCSRQTTCQEDPIMRNEQKIVCEFYLKPIHWTVGWMADLNPSQWVSYNSSTGSIIPGWTAENHFEATSWPSAGAPILCISVVKGMRTTVVLICFDRMFLFWVPPKHKMTQARDFLNVPRMRWWCSLQIMFNAPHVGPNKNSKPN